MAAIGSIEVNGPRAWASDGGAVTGELRATVGGLGDTEFVLANAR